MITLYIVVLIPSALLSLEASLRYLYWWSKSDGKLTAMVAGIAITQLGLALHIITILHLLFYAPPTLNQTVIGTFMVGMIVISLGTFMKLRSAWEIVYSGRDRFFQMLWRAGVSGAIVLWFIRDRIYQ